LTVAALPRGAEAQGTAAPLPTSLPIRLYEERGLIPGKTEPVAAPAAGLAARSAPAAGYRTTSFTAVLTKPTTYTVDLTSQTRVTNRSIRLTNTGTVDVRTPWVVANGTRDWYDATRIAKEALGAETSNDLKAFRLWQFVRAARYHWYPAEVDIEVHSPVKLLNVYGYGFCDDSATNLECLLRTAGFSDSRCWDIGGHGIAEVKYDGAYRMLDADLEVFYPMWDNRTVAGVADCASDPGLVSRVSGNDIAQLYSTTANNLAYQKRYTATPTMAVTLRPRESLERFFFNWGKYHDNYMVQEPPVYGNGRHNYEPDLGDPATASRFQTSTNLTFGGTPRMRVSDGQVSGEGVLAMSAPYVYVGGSVSGTLRLDDTSCTADILFSKNGASWTTVRSFRGPLAAPFAVSLDNAIATTRTAALYALRVKVRLGRGSVARHAGLESLSVCGEIQCAPAALPTLMYSRANPVSVAFTATGTPRLEVVHEWDESDEEPPIVPPPAPISPEDGATTMSLTPDFIWASPLADEPDVWRRIKITWDPEGFHPVSPLTSVRGEMPNYWEAPGDWLRPGNTYYWRVKEQDTLAPWSASWSFRTGAAASVAGWSAY
jgi:hypothetical protein